MIKNYLEYHFELTGDENFSAEGIDGHFNHSLTCSPYGYPRMDTHIETAFLTIISNNFQIE